MRAGGVRGGSRGAGPGGGTTGHRATLLLAGMLACGAGPMVARGEAPVRRDPSCGALPIVQVTDVVIYRLPHSFLTAVADSARSRHGTYRQRSDFLVDRLRGEVRLLRAPVAGETLWVEACWLLDPPALEYQRLHYTPAATVAPESAAATTTAPARPGTAHDLRAVPGGASLTINGNKTIAVDFGSSQDAFLRQSLDLAISGSLAPGVELTGVLSDRNTPLTAAGSTQDLQSIDRVLLELRTPAGGAAFGDVALQARDGEFARVERRLQGVKADWRTRGFTGSVAAASAPGEFHRLQFPGVEGQQGPYLLTDRDGGTAITVIAGSEIVTVDDARMARGEGADYSIEYDRARLTFSNRRPITSASRITVEYQYSVNRYRRSFAEAGGRWDRGPLQLFTRVLTEGDDRGRPLDLVFDSADRLALALAGDSLGRAIGTGVTAGGGDYDSVRLSGRVIYAFAGPDLGSFAVRFARVGPGLGDYADSTAVAGRVTFRFVGAGAGAFRVGQALPLPESHRVWSVGGSFRRGVLALEAEGALSQRDLNTASPNDDQDNKGSAGRVALSLEGGSQKHFARAGLTFAARNVERRFAPFGRLERPFAQEDWGLPVGGDLERQQRIEAAGFVSPRGGGQLRWRLASLQTPTGFRALRRSTDWQRDGTWSTRGSYERADGTQPGLRFGRGGRERALGELRWRGGWIEPSIRGEVDRRRTPSDSGRAGVRSREGALDLASGSRLAWHASLGTVLRRDAAAQGEEFRDRVEARTWRARVESPATAALGAVMSLQRRDARPLGDGARTRSDLASIRLAAEHARRGLAGNADLEITSEGESRRVRTPVFAGSGLGNYDAFGNFVGRGDYDLGITLLPGLERLSRSALSARAAWNFGAGDTWRGSHLEFSFECDARRRGEFLVADAVISPGRVVGDPAIAQGSVAQRLESELAPGARFSNLRLRLERRVSADRSFDNFSQTLEERNGQVRWRARFNGAWSAEIEGRARRQQASQSLAAGAAFRRTLIERGGNSQWIFQPGDRLRAAAVIDASWSRSADAPQETRTLRIGPDASVAVGGRGRATLSARRAFFAGPSAIGLLPSADPAGVARWEATTHFDLRVRESTTFGLSYGVTDREGVPTRSTGRAELRAFF